MLANELAELTVINIKTATASACELYAMDNDPLLKVNDLNIILDRKDEAICITKTTKISIVPFLEVSEEHVFKEGEGDRSLENWKKEHTELFPKWYEEENLEIHDNIPVFAKNLKWFIKKTGT